MVAMTSLRSQWGWRQPLALAALLVGFVVMHAGLQVVSCSGQQIQQTAMSVHPASTWTDASVHDASHNSSLPANDCGHGMGQICPAVLSSTSSHLVSALSLLVFGGVLSAVMVGAMGIHVLGQRQRRRWPRSGPTLSSLCILRI